MDDITLIHGDSLEVVAGLGEIGAIITDPPYGIAHKTNHGASWAGREIQGDSSAFLSNWIIEWAESKNLPWAVFGNWKCQRPQKCRGVLIWDKGPAFGMGDLSFPWKMSWEEIYIGGPLWNGKRDEGVLRDHMVVSWESKGRKHPHQKPVSLMQAILAKLPSELVILDPFCGSGSTLVACQKSGRRAIGIENDQAYIDVAKRRIKEAETPLFSGLS